MLLDYIKQRQQMLENNNNFYTPNGIHVYTKDELVNDSVDLESTVSELEAKLPEHIRDGIEMVIVGHFDEFDERGINAFYKDGALYVSNVQDDGEDLLDDLVHETAHSVEEQYGMEIYADQKIKDEFLRKREHMYNVLWKMGFKAPKQAFTDTEYDQGFDEFLHLREYFATAFTEFYLHPDSHGYLQRVSPEVYKKLMDLHRLDQA
jgi:hypothetical protein